MNPTARREPLVDALRAWAILGVLIVNVQSYLTGPWGSPLGVPAPAESQAAWAAHGLVAWLFQGKAYPLLAFLFGYGQALGLRAGEAVARRRRRMRRLIVLGVLHGALLFAGDILTLYGLCGLALLTQARQRLHAVFAQLRLWLGLALVMLVLGYVFLALPGVLEPQAATYRDVAGVAEFLVLNGEAYLISLAGSLVFFGPEVMTLMTAGFIAGRLGIFTRRRWRGALARLARWALPLGLAGNAAYALAASTASIGAPEARPWIGLIGPLGWLLAAGYAGALASAWHAGPPRWLCALVPLGRYTLSLYVGLSLLCAVVLSGAGLGWQAGTVALLLGAVLLWGVALAIARRASARGRRGPLEAWMARA